jgi:hypothetical protein
VALKRGSFIDKTSSIYLYVKLKAQYTTHEGAYFTGFSGYVTFKGFNE